MSSNWLQEPLGARPAQERAEFRPAGMSDDEKNEDDSDSDFDFGFGFSSDRYSYNNYSSTTKPKNESFTQVPSTSEARQPVKLPLLLQPLRYAIVKGSKQNIADCLAKLSKSPDFYINSTTLNDPSDMNKWSALMFACHTPRPEILRFIIEQGADPKGITNQNCTGLIALACADTQYGDFTDMLECAQILIDSGVEVNEVESTLGATALHFAVRNNHTDLVQFLLQNDANINQLDKDGRSPLHWAASHGSGPVIKILLKYNPDLEILSGSGLYAFEVAALGGFPETAKSLYLCQKGKLGMEQMDLSALSEIEISTEEKQRRKMGANRYGTTVERNHVESVLSQLKLKMFFPMFDKAGITLQKFLQLTDEDIVKIGVTKVGHRIKLMEVIRQMHNSDWKRSSLISFPPNSIISMLDATLFCKNVAYHVDLMSATLNYLAVHASRPLKDSTVLTPSLSIDEPQRARVQTFCQKLTAATDALGKNVKLLRDFILQIKDNPEYVIGDYIGKPVD